MSHKIDEMVIVIVAAPQAGGMAIGRALALELGWPFVEASTGRESVGSVHAMIARTLGRREHMVIVFARLSPDEMDMLKGELKGVRFVHPDADTPASELIPRIRREFGF